MLSCISPVGPPASDPLPPMLFRRTAFPHLARLEGDQGGKRVFLDLPHTATVPLTPRQAIDIDTRDDMSE